MPAFAMMPLHIMYHMTMAVGVGGIVNVGGGDSGGGWVVGLLMVKAVHIDSWLSEGTWWSAYSVIHFFRSSGAKDQLPGH